MSSLISNAHKYTPPSGEITVYTEPATLLWAEDGRSRALLVAVRDTRIGINSDYFTLPLAPPSPEPAATMVEANEA